MFDLASAATSTYGQPTKSLNTRTHVIWLVEYKQILEDSDSHQPERIEAIYDSLLISMGKWRYIK
jgi:hypothetical protein